MKASSHRFPIIDFFKFSASQLIVWHHLAAYGPVSDAAYRMFPDFILWLYDYARIAVQVFFVIGGYLAARSILSKNNPAFVHSVFNRYVRLAIPFFFALILAIICAAISRHLFSDEFIPDAPQFLQFFSHLLLLNGVLNFDSLLAGAWFIAIDFQLFFALLSIAWLANKTRYADNIVVLSITLLSILSFFWFNRDTDYDDWALYFFGAYGLGALAYFASHQERGSTWFWVTVTLAVVALHIDFRSRIMLAVLIALTLFLSTYIPSKLGSVSEKVVHYLGTISYSLFLVHFSVLMIANALFSWLRFTDPTIGMFFMVATWLISLLLADYFYNKIEKPGTALLKLKMKHH